MGQITSIACGLPFCQHAEGDQTKLSIGLRITALALGVILATIGVLVLLGIPGLSQLGTVAGGTVCALGALFVFAGTLIKCISKKSDQEQKNNLPSKNDINQTNKGNKEVKTEEVKVRKQTSSRPQDASLEDISNMTKESMDKLCKSIKVNNRNDYIKCMLIFAIKAEKFHDGFVDLTFHDAIPYFQGENGEPNEFVHEDIAAGRSNQDDTLLHEILKCKLLSPKAKGSAFGFILRDGHDYLRDYLGNRTYGEKNQWGNRPKTFPVVKWGDSLKKIFDTFSTEEQKEFFANSDGIAARLKSFTDIAER